MYKERISKKVLSWILSLAVAASLLPVGMFGGTVTVQAAPGDADARTENITSNERKIKINDDWRFCLLDKARAINDSLDATASQKDYTESGKWNTVQLPHDWSIYQEFSDTEARAAQGSLAGGTGWYRKSFTLSEDMMKKNIVLQFDAVQMVSQVWINGHDLGKQFLGYVTFEYDITEYLNPAGQENVIAVKAYSSPNSARWYSGAGIYGSVYLIATDKVHVPVNGVHVATVVKEGDKYMQPDFHTEPDMEALKKKSTVNVRTSVENKTNASAAVSVKSVIYSKDNPKVAEQTTQNITVQKGETEKVNQIIEIDNPALWNVDDPNLYWVKTEIIQNGKVIDTLDTRFGIRYLYLQPGTYEEPYSEENTLGGLFINGEYTRINGMCEHRDLGALGMETYQAAIDRRIRKLKDMGVNVVRCAHNPVSPEYIEAADRLGMLIFEEGFDQWLKAKNSDDYHNYFNKAADGTTTVFEYSAADGSNTYINWLNTELEPNCVRDIQAMVDRDKNSPSIFLWSTGNEIYDSSDGHGMDTQWLLSAAVKEIDSLDNIPWTNVVDKTTKRTVRPEPEENHAALPSAENNYTTDYSVRGGSRGEEKYETYGARYGRPISAAPPTWDTGNNKVTRDNGFIDNMALADIGGHNYSRATNQYTTHKKRYPNACVAGTETVSAFYTRGVYNIEDYQGANEEGGRWASSSGYASEWPYNKNFTSASISIREHRDDMMPFMFGEMVWTGHDYLGEPTPHSSPSRSSYFGIIDTAGFEKDAFYMYRSAWTDIPTVHLLPQKWNWDMGTQVPIMVYTNAASVEVFINGKSIGSKKYDRDTAEPVYLDYGMQEYQAGELKAVAKDKDGNVIAEDVVYTAGDAQSVVLSGEKAFIKNDGNDLLYVEATVVDSAGIMVPTADNRITFEVEGGEIVALDNGDPRDREPFRGVNNNNNSNTSNNRKAFNGKALAIIKAEKGAENIVVTAKADKSGGQIGSNMLTVGAVDEVGDGTSVDRYTLPEVTTGVGVSATLPKTIGVVYNDGLIQDCAIDSWDDMDKVDLNQPGSYTVYAVSKELEERVATKIHVKEIASIDDVEVTTIAGVEPALPNFVALHFKDGENGSAQVTWETVDPSQYAEEGVFDVTGKIGPNKTVNAEVMVKEIQSIEDIAISTERGTLPTMPSTVEVAFTDGSKEPIGVKWNISENDVKSAGQKKITGTVLGSDTKAVVWLNVSTVVYASDLDYKANPADKVFKDTMANGESLQARGMQGGPGEVYDKGLGTQAPAEIEIDIAGKGYERFRSYANLSLLKGGVAAPGAVAFKVYLDDETEPVFSSGDMDKANEAVLIDIDVTGKSKIRLVTESKSGNVEDDYADWVNARFLSGSVVIDEILTPQLYTAKANEKPQLPDTIQAKVPGIKEPVTFHVKWLTSVSDAMFTSGSVQKVYGQIEGAKKGKMVTFTYMTDYETACQQEGFAEKLGSWSVTETFDYTNIASDQKVKFSNMKLTPKLIHSGTSGMLVENVGKYGFNYGIYPDPNSGSESVVFATPGLTYFQVRNVGYTVDISNSKSFTFETSTDGDNWTEFTAFTKGDILEGTGTDASWAQRNYTSNEGASFPAGTNFLRVKYPSGETWRYNMTQIVLKGGSGTAEEGDTDIARFALGEYAGTVNQTAGTINLTVPTSFDITSVEPEIITVNAEAAVTPAGPQNFTKPVTYTVTHNGATKTYTVTVNRGVEVSFHPYGGTINDDSQAIVNFISKGSSTPLPADPVRQGYVFGGWTTDRSSKEAAEVEGMKFETDTVFYAIWTKDPFVSVKTDADACVKTWQKEKTTNYGSEGTMMMRQPADISVNGQFGEKFTSTSTSDGTDMKTSYIRFGVEDFKNQNVKSVKLSLHYAGNQNGEGTNNIKILATRAASDWEEKKVTWITRPEIFDANDIAESEEFSATANGSRQVELDVTKFYEALAEGENQICFAVTANSNARDFKLTSKEGATGVNVSKAPHLMFEVEKDPDYMVTYDLNGGQGVAPIQPTMDAGSVFAAAKGTGIKGAGDKQFAGWNTKADGTGTFYHAGDEVSMPNGDLILYAVYKDPVTITANNKKVFIEGNTLDLSAQGLFAIDSNAGTTHKYSVLSGGTGKGRIDKTNGKTLSISKFGSIRIKLTTSETDTHMKGSAVAVLTVNPKGAITAIRVEESAKTMTTGESYQIKAVVVPEDTTDDKTLTFKSENEEVATVDASGLVTAHKKGKANIEISCVREGVTASVEITVSDKEIPITQIKVKESTAAMKMGENYQIEASVVPENTTDDKTLTYKSLNETIATVNASGLVTAKAEGTARIEITCVRPGVKSEVTVTVSKSSQGGASEEDRKQLDNEVKKLEAAYKDLSKYTADSAKAFRNALEAAKKVLSNPKATKADVDQALTNLAKAKAGLKLNSTTTPKPPKKGYKFKSGALQYEVTRSKAKNGTVAVVKLVKKTNKKVTIPATVKVKGFTFKVTRINSKVFQNNKKLQKVVIGSNVSAIGTKSFYGCKKLKEVVIGANVSTIGTKSFYGCKNLSKITFKGMKAPKAGKNAFKGIKKSAKVYVPKKVSKKNLKKFKTIMKTAGKKVVVKKSKK